MKVRVRSRSPAGENSRCIESGRPARTKPVSPLRLSRREKRRRRGTHYLAAIQKRTDIKYTSGYQWLGAHYLVG